MDWCSLSSAFILSIFEHAILKNYISAVIYSSKYGYTSLERAKIKLQKKNILVSANPYSAKKKNKQGIFLDNYLKKILRA